MEVISNTGKFTVNHYMEVLYWLVLVLSDLCIFGSHERNYSHVRIATLEFTVYQLSFTLLPHNVFFLCVCGNHKLAFKKHGS